MWKVTLAQHDAHGLAKMARVFFVCITTHRQGTDVAEWSEVLCAQQFSS